MRRVFHALFALVLPAAVGAQSLPDSTKLEPAVRVSLEQEIALAMSAAPPAVAQAAEIWVLGANGYEKARDGTNGYGCIVQRGMRGQSLIPRCDDPSGVKALFPIYQLIETMRAQGRSHGDVRRAMAEGYRSGTLQAPRHGGFSYMYSVDAYFTTADGRRLPFTPHVMVYWPNCDYTLLGVTKSEELRGSGLAMLDYATPECTLIINTPPATARHVDAERPAPAANDAARTPHDPRSH